MSKSAKNHIIIASILVGVGLIIFTCVMFAYGWDFSKLSTVNYETNTLKLSGVFDKISIDVDTTEIEFIPTADEECTIVCFEAEKEKHSAIVQNDTLILNTVDTRKWYDHINISFKSPKITVYLPKNEYASLSIKTHTGDIVIPKDFVFGSIGIDGNTSDVKCFSSVTNELNIKLSTGDINIDNITLGQLKLSTTTGAIEINSVTAKNFIDIKANTGSIKMANISCADLIAEDSTGSISLTSVIATGYISIESSTGNVNFNGSNAAEISVKTSTGNVTGTLLSEKVFITESSTGKISVPGTTSGGRCEIKTSTGDIKIEIK